MWTSIVLLVFGLFCVKGQIIQNGQCSSENNVLLEQNFDITKFLGTWYELRSIETPWSGDCATIEFTTVGESLTVYHRSVKQNFLQEQFGTASIETNSPKITLSLPQVGGQPINFWIQVTDYENFALAYGCQNLGSTQRQVHYWQLSRNTTLVYDLVPALFNTTMVDTAGILPTDLKDVSHEEEACYLLPGLEAGQPIIIPGQCDESILGVENFNVSRFLGVWHEVNSYYSENVSGTCARAQYSDGGSVVNVVNSQIINETLFTIEGSASLLGNDGRAKLNVTLEIIPGVLANSELLVLGTDYDQWAVSYTCVNLNSDTRQIFSWILSRTRVLPDSARAEVNQLLNSYVELNEQYYKITDQSQNGCFYAPTPVPNTPAVFGGQCEENVNVVPNFNAAEYLGTWYQIEAYPAAFQDGSCSKAVYSLGDGVVDVLNTQVVNETLDSINAFAVQVGTGGHLKVTFPIAGTNGTITTDYWVIATDYGNFSLVYSCSNINDYQQQVTAWKLSRSKQLSDAANSEITSAINSIPVLSQNYFEETDQSDEGCFYFPEPNGVVKIPGQCDNNIKVVENFNFTGFSGLWYEVESYPKEQQEGHCINHQFNVLSNTQLSVGSSNVVDQLLTVTSGSMTLLNATSTEGRFNLSIQTSNGLIQFPYYIIDTDYVDYALVYSCVNDGDEFMNVYSWKLSRSPQLSSAAAASIANVTSDIRVIDERYFETVLQDDNACFYFPDNLSQGAPVTLDGQCSNNILAMENFNAERYLGLWRLIETYPSDNQDGNCNTQDIQLINGNIEVLNSEVLNQTLSTATGIAVLASDTYAVLNVTFPGAPIPFQYYVLDTDYDTYSLVYGCIDLNLTNYRVYSWKLSRTKSLSETAKNAINAVIDTTTVLNNRYYVQIDQSDDACFYYPETGAPVVIFPGQCDETIPVVTGFDPVAYGGLWHGISSYPLPFQTGDCPNARYSIGTVGVDVYNTQVINQTLDTINGFAVLADANSTEAKLLVTFPSIGNFTSNYWILAVDYDDYALVYNCQNLDDEYRQVSSWKLSRTRSWSANATTVFNNIASSIPVLDERYFIDDDQSDEACFYYPTPQEGVPVVFPGQCDNNTAVMQNFNLTQFSGTWYEIESYPKEQQTGNCISHEFSVTSNNTLGLQSFNVIAESLGVTEGVVTFSDAENSGRLTISFTSNGTSYEIPYWVLDTDYNNYAVVYSCVNIDSITKGVWSWKLSRTRELSNSSIASIANVTSTIVELDDKYYEVIDHSDEACFYLPDLAPGEPVIFPGQCSNVTAIPNFDAARYLGKWKLIETYPSSFQFGDCGEAEYSLGVNDIIVSNSEVINDTLSVMVGSAVLVDSGVFVVTFPFINDQFIELRVLDTDYDSYSIVYSCENVGSEQRRIYSWKLSRTNSLTANATLAINAVVDSIDVLNDRYYVPTNRTPQACFYYPEPTGNPVVFRAQCDLSIPVVTQFDPVAYGGLWYDIASYPTFDQNGQCSNAYYTLGENGVDVFNTEVINQTLDTINGFAVLADANSTEAKLLVTFPTIGNFTSDYWVLATDYDSYALVYSCTNIDDEYMQVFSWKLSRTKSLTQNATAEINSVINSIPVLGDQYYLERDQSDEGCFYFPEVQPGVPVVFPGRCDPDLPVVQGFNISQFEGVWNEIETYPKLQQTGQCISHEFLVSGNSFELNSLNVVNGTQTITNGIVTNTSSDNSAKFVITISSNNSTIEIPYWIIDTDYNNYALAYSCVDLENERGVEERGVWSWKLSRTKELAAPFEQMINNATSNINVIDNRYFEPVQQDNDACFYVPDINPGDPVVFPGQCDPNPTGIQDFDAARYLGVWNLIETYPSGFQVGTCADATYSLAPDGSVVVLNSEVVNQTLSTMVGSAVLGNNSGVLVVTFPDAPPLEYIVLDTDYESYSIVYSCVNINPDERRVYSWKLSRTNSLSANATAAINQVISATNILVPEFYETVNRSDSNCFYFPEPSDNPVEFRGSCDPNIAVVPDFDAGRYLGTWNLIENYPSQFQFGTCATADYSLAADGSVIVLNQEVYNQTLMTEIGTAVVIGNAKLSVTFPNADTPIEYWVLDTDYDSFSIVYSCQNIPNNRRRIQSWKLSRSDVLENANAINAAIDRVDVLDQRYYKTVDRSDSACFYYPEPSDNPVEFRGQCDPNITVVEDFDAARYLGSWNLIENYPSQFQFGTCATADYSLAADGSVIVLNQEVYNQTLMTEIGTAVVIGNAKLSVTFPNADTPIEYWVLDTDYDSFSIVYSCQNIPNNRRRIQSWKLSRSDVLENANAINAAIDRVDVLDQRYYKTVDRSDSGCFYYPEPSDNPVEFRGQCDPNVAVIPNFDAAKYLGTWNLIENYPSQFQVGNCATADYSLAPDGTVVVLNQEVNNQTLFSDIGTAVIIDNAKLSVTFPDAPSPIEYWVLDTDYDSYSIVYSCVNLDNNKRQVFSWKLSRTNTLSASNINSINAVMNQVDVLDQRYYQVVNRTDAACFYYPEPSNNPVILPGSCDQSIAIVENFDIAQYAGTWYQIERYPQTFEDSDSTCAAARYEFDESEGVVNLVNWEVVNGELWALEGTATPASNDGKANFTVVLPDVAAGEGTVTSSLYVLDTDYTSYSLAYSCANLEGNKRSIGVWKLSRSLSMSPEDNAKIDAVIAQRQELDERYFLKVEQNEDCPEPSSGAIFKSSIIVIITLTLLQYFM